MPRSSVAANVLPSCVESGGVRMSDAASEAHKAVRLTIQQTAVAAWLPGGLTTGRKTCSW